jgi:hypothetical protein
MNFPGFKVGINKMKCQRLLAVIELTVEADVLAEF